MHSADIAHELLSRWFVRNNISRGKIEAAINVLELREKCHAVIADITLAAIRTGIIFSRPVYVRNVAIEFLDLSEITEDYSQIEFQDCLFTELEIPPESGCFLPRFNNCYIGHLHGRVSAKDLPVGVFDERCSVDKFEESSSTTNHIMQLSLPVGNKVLLTLLKKLYVQKGSGRRENALHRGLDERARRLVPEVLRILTAEGLAFVAKRADNKVWYPVRSESKRVFALLNAPSNCVDPLVQKTAGLSS